MSNVLDDVRAANPVREPRPLPADMRERIVAAIVASERTIGGGAYRRRWRRLPLAGVAFALLAASAGALAATGLIRLGSPVGVPHVLQTPASASVGNGVVSSASGLLATAPDPDGGLAWGMRLAKTSRDAGCYEVGRVENGTLGVLGVDGAFHDDGRFHQLPAGLSRSSPVCAPLGRNGLLFESVTSAGVAASGVDASGLWITVGGCLSSGTTEHGPGNYCKASELRDLYYGSLGPDAVSLIYQSSTNNRTKTLRLSATHGNYLIVERASGTNDFSNSLLPSAPIISVTFRNGLHCNLTNQAPPAGACAHPPGLEPALLPHYTHAELAATVRAIPDYTKQLGWGFLASFTARAPVTNALSGYDVDLKLPGCGGEFSTHTSNVTRNTHISLSGGALPTKPGKYHGAVYFVSNATDGPLHLIPGRNGADGVLVGRFTLTVPPHHGRGITMGCN